MKTGSRRSLGRFTAIAGTSPAALPTASPAELGPLSKPLYRIFTLSNRYAGKPGGMKKLIVSLLATAALATPAAAWAHHGWHHHHDFVAKFSGTGTSFGAATATASGSITGGKLSSGTFAASISTDWSKAVNRSTDRGSISCAPSTATLTLNASTTMQASLVGKTCTWTPTSGSVVRAFFGRSEVLKTFLAQKADGTVKGAV